MSRAIEIRVRAAEILEVQNVPSSLLDLNESISAFVLVIKAHLAGFAADLSLPLCSTEHIFPSVHQRE